MPYTDNSIIKGTNNWLTATSVAAAAAQNATYSGWGLTLPSPTQQQQPQPQPQPQTLTTNSSSSLWSSIIGPTTANKTLVDFVKESAAWHGPLTNPGNQQQQHNHQQISAATSMPWAAAVKAPSNEQQHHQQQQTQHQQQQHNHHASLSSSISSNLSNANAFDCNRIGSWSSPETNSSNRGGWNADVSAKNDGAFDDGTAIWGNPSTKKTGIDWTEKESLSNPPQATSNQEKRIQKPEPVISSINGTEAWGAPATSALFKQSIPNSNNSISSNNSSSSNCSQQQPKLNDNSGNIYGSNPANEALSWGEASSLKAKNENSSPPSNSVWSTSAASAPNHINNNNNISKQRSSDWLASSSGTSSSSTSVGMNPWIDELNKELEATSLFDVNSLSSSTSSSLAKNSTSPSSLSNSNLDNQSSAIGACLANGILGTNAGTIGVSLGNGGSNAINDLKQTMGANNFSNNSLSANSNPQSQNNSCAFSMGVTPSRDLLKQMVHQIQLAVQAGHINAHILNQQMSTPTLQLVYTLLQQIKLLHQFQEIQQRSVNKSSDTNSPSNLDLQISRVQQNISLLQRAITQQQAALTKNQTSNKRNIDAQAPAASSFNSSTLGGLSLQSNPWLFAPSGDSRPAPPPGLINSNNFSSIIGNSSNVDGTNDANSNKQGLSSENESHLQSRESSSNLWSGAWFD